MLAGLTEIFGRQQWPGQRRCHVSPPATRGPRRPLGRRLRQARSTSADAVGVRAAAPARAASTMRAVRRSKSEPCQRPATRACSCCARGSNARSRARSASVSASGRARDAAVLAAARASAGNHCDGRPGGRRANDTWTGISTGRDPRVQAGRRQTMVAPGGRPPGHARTQRHGRSVRIAVLTGVPRALIQLLTRRRTRSSSPATFPRRPRHRPARCGVERRWLNGAAVTGMPNVPTSTPAARMRERRAANAAMISRLVPACPAAATRARVDAAQDGRRGRCVVPGARATTATPHAPPGGTRAAGSALLRRRRSQSASGLAVGKMREGQFSRAAAGTAVQGADGSLTGQRR